MKPLFPILILALLCPLYVIGAEVPDIRVIDAYVRGLPPGVQNTAAYMVIENHGDSPLTLTGAHSPVAQGASLHETIMQDGQMSMIPVSSLVIPATGHLVLESGARHFMLMGLNAPLVEGEEITMTLLFDGGNEFQLSLPVRSVLSETNHSGH